MKAVWDFYLLEASGIGFIVCLLTIFIGRRLRSRVLIKICKYGLIVFAIVAAISLFNLFNRDWSIPECRDESGALISEKENCQFH